MPEFVKWEVMYLQNTVHINTLDIINKGLSFPLLCDGRFPDVCGLFIRPFADVQAKQAVKSVAGP